MAGSPAAGPSPTRNSKRNRIVSSVGTRARDVLQEDYSKVKATALEAVKSKAFIYPVKGVFYFLSHRALWKPFLSRLGPYCILSISVIGAMFALTYLPQLAVLVFVNGPLAVVSTVFLVLNESSAIINVISRGFLLDDALLDTFDGTMVACNGTDLVREGRQVKSGSDPIQRLGKILKSPFERLGPKAIIRYLVYLPLNLIPVVGTATFLFLQARNRGQLVHSRYFQLRKWSPSQKSEWLEKHMGPYTAFGLVALLLEMIPLVSVFFTYTNTVGAALWAADIEALATPMSDKTSPGLRNKAKKAE